ncbi:MAG TPA: DinB family protein [Candidatus Acidoferrales bacterium]|nr:DinB family protein [Candidatus Acidoferrales bacterium]
MDSREEGLLNALLDSWDRNNRIVVNLARAVPERGLAARAMVGSPSVAEMLSHIHYVRLVFVSEDAPEFAKEVPDEWTAERERERIIQLLDESAAVVRNAVKGRLAAGRQMDMHFDHPILMLQQLIWHEGYHHGQIKLALKAAGCALSNQEIGPLTWRVWMNKTPGKPAPR